MDEQNDYDWLGDDGEFTEPVDDRYGVYSPLRHGYWWRRVSAAMMGLFACGVFVFGMVYWAT